MARILIVDGDQGVRTVLKAMLKRDGYDVDDLASGKEAIARMKEISCDLVITDLMLGNDGSGYEVLREARKDGMER
jgi:DNA-binding response OmpR family regulator